MLCRYFKDNKIKNSTHLIYAVNYNSYKYMIFLSFKIKVSLKQDHVITNTIISYVSLFISNLRTMKYETFL